MSKKMLIDASHPEETRVVVQGHNKVEEFDFESASKKPIRGNIYLAKVTRVEPSLQAAFVEYGGNRHGFLAFNEIHPDYYQIPHADRLALEAEIEAALKSDVEEADAEADAVAEHHEDEADETEASVDETVEDEASDEEADDADDESIEDSAEEPGHESDEDDDDGADQALIERKRRQFYRKYKIQEVIKRRQILLVQAAKEERGNKGAALTTYLSLAGRYCVLMPNTPRGGGISRKISSATDRKRLKGVVSSLDLPKGSGLIIRTAGAKRTKLEIKRDADYLIRLWSQIREDTLKSVAPALIYEEGNLVKRAIRDLYDKDIDSILVEGEEAYKEAKAFIKMLMPSHARKVKHYKEMVPLFLGQKVESQLEAIYSPVAPLKSGGYLVINPTEALVSIDVNSGRSTRERNIEQTALRTNLEAAEEAARQMRLRDLAGLIVIDFIDMEESKNNRAVEKKMKDVLKRDRARLQMGRISQFGLMEISRQRRRTSLIEGSTTECPTCQGHGYVRSVESSALLALRGLEEEALRGRAKKISCTVATSTALYLLNDKRDHLLSIEERFGVSIVVTADPDQLPPHFAISVIEQRSADDVLNLPKIELEVDEEPVIDEPVAAEDEDEGEKTGRRRRRRRRRRGGGSGEEAEAGVEARSESESDSDDTKGDDTEGEDAAPAAEGESGKESAPRRRRRRGRRGGRGRRRSEDNAAETSSGESDAAESQPAGADKVSEAAPDTDAETNAETGAETAAEAGTEAIAEDKAEKPKRKRAPRKKKPEADTEADTEAPAEAAADSAAEEKPKRKRAPRKKKAEEAAPETVAEAVAETASDAETKPAEDDKPKRKRAPRKKKVEAEAETGAATETKAQPEPKSEPEPEPVAAEAGEASGGEEKKPQRKGWWQKTFGR